MWLIVHEYENGSTRLINTDNVEDIVGDDKAGSVINFLTNSELPVRETLEDFIGVLGAIGKNVL
jgi:hypothetical protein